MKKSIDQLVREVAHSTGIDQAEIDRRKNYLGIAEQDVSLLAATHDRLAHARRNLIDRFYADMLAFPATREFLEDEQTLKRLKSKQGEYFDSLTRGDYGPDYVHDRLRVGLVHQQIGLEPKLYLGAYCRYLCDLLPGIRRLFPDDPDRVLALTQALFKITFFDIGLALDTYIHADRRSIAKLKNYNEAIICNMPSGLLVLNGKLEVVSANLPLGNMLGIRHETLRGQALDQAVPQAELRVICRQVLDTGVPRYDVPVIARRQGKERHLRVSVTPFRDGKDSDEARLLLALDDRTEQLQLQQELADSDTQLRTILDNLGEAVITIDERGTIQSFNRAAERIFGYASAEAVGHNVKRLMPEPYHSEHDGYLSRYVRTGESKCLGIDVREVEGQRRSGAVFPMELSTSETRVAGKRLFIGIVRDISERRRAEQETQKLSSAAEQTADSIIITNREGVIEYVNPAFEATTGFPAREAVGRRPSIVRSGLHDKAFYRKLWETILAGEPYREVFINRRRDGEIYYEEKSITPIKDPRGNITHFVSAGKDITERMRTQERLNYLAHHDAVTELPNRVLFSERLQHAVIQARRRGHTVAVLFIDLDRFKVINDTLGHDVGDALLKAVAARLKQPLREGDTVARLGGDEFGILLEDVTAGRDVGPVAQKLLSIMNEPFLIESNELHVSISIGIALYPVDGDKAGTLLKHADVAMYRAKSGGRAGYQFYTSDMNERAEERLRMETDLRHALERDQFVLHYQPQVDLTTGSVIGVEALLRWQHPELGLVPPLEFIPLVEEIGLIHPVGEWVMEQACRQCRAWRAAGVPPMQMAVNLSAHQLLHPHITDRIEASLDRAGLDEGTRCLELEITESLLMDNVEQTIDKLNQLNRMGIRLSIDDFGTGYSSLAYLKRFPVQTLKIDRSFVRDLASDPDDAAIVKAVIAMAHSLNLKVIAEGVETAEQLAFLREHRCDAIQGYLFARPLPADELLPLLSQKLEV